ncbi:MAG: radical SAM protein, partial [Desulfomonilaceae bacterium]|nr:radical SAM protein [Desulfomonilaceae bacterium]
SRFRSPHCQKKDPGVPNLWGELFLPGRPYAVLSHTYAIVYSVTDSGQEGDVLRVLLINSNLRDDLFAAPPIGLCYVAGATEAAGHEVQVLDLCFKRHVFKELDAKIGEFSPHVVGVSIRNLDNANMLYPVSYLPEARRVLDRVRQTTTAPIVVGGSAAGLSPAGILNLLGADFVVVSDGEKTFVDLLECIGKGETPENIPGVAMMLDGRFHTRSPRLGDFSGPSPDLGKWIDLRPYQNVGSSFGIQTKRGCRQRCIYCTYNQVLEGNRLRLRSPLDVVDEIEEALRKHNPESFEFVDSVFNDPQDYCTEILEEIVRRPWRARFTAMGVNPKGLDHGFLELMKRAGFTSLMITPESASPTMLENYRKGFTIDDVIHAAEAVNRSRFMSMWFFLVGGPGETNETLRESLDFTLKYLKQDRGPFFKLINYFLGIRVYPRTRLWEIASGEGLVCDQDDALDPVWYLSSDLDLEQAMRQMITTAARCPQMISGFDERYLALSGIIAFIGKLFHLNKPYWNVLTHANRVLRKPALRLAFNPEKIARTLRDRLDRRRKGKRP